MVTVGFSTGALALGDFSRGLELLEGRHADAVELSALRVAELPLLLAALPARVDRLKERYHYISLHAPSDFQDERALVEQLGYVAGLGWNIVVHPDALRDVKLWRELGGCVCLENMDSRKRTGRTVKELRPFFDSLPEAKLCFDIAHARQVDPTMTETSQILLEFGDRLAEVHMSEVDGLGRHFAMSLGAKIAYEQFSEILLTVPNILESIVSEKKIDAEIDAARAILNHRVNQDLRTLRSESVYAH